MATFNIVPAPFRKHWTEHLQDTLEGDLIRLFKGVNLEGFEKHQFLVKETGQRSREDFPGEGIRVGAAKAFMIEIFARYEGNPWDIWEITLPTKDTHDLREHLLAVSQGGVAFSSTTSKVDSFVQKQSQGSGLPRTIKRRVEKADMLPATRVEKTAEMQPVAMEAGVAEVSPLPVVRRRMHPKAKEERHRRSNAKIMEDPSGMALTLLFLLTRADVQGEIQKADLTETLISRYGYTSRQTRPLHQTFVTQGFLQRVGVDNKYRILERTRIFIGEHWAQLKISQTAQQQVAAWEGEIGDLASLEADCEVVEKELLEVQSRYNALTRKREAARQATKGLAEIRRLLG